MPAGAPVRLSSTSAAAGGVLPFNASLSSTDGVLPPVTGLIGAALKLSSLAARLPTVMLMLAVAVAHSVVFGAGRQAW
ncbi:hypothetical protein [Stenotrophomonas cyclobalanopsidis]|uniref:hypothetical protein n=1 Tax=Stenotrophomonas cyclobalanopsidis TaxID=2771362 RepID=UPI00345FFE41